MRRGLVALFALLGACIIIITIYNVQVGVVKDIYSDNAPRYKLDIPAFITSEECTDKTLTAGFAKGMPAKCARSVGIWETPDFIGIGIGIGLLLFSRKLNRGVKKIIKSGSAEKRLRRKRRNAKIKFGFGLGLLVFGFADMNGMTTKNGSLDWSAIIGVPTPAISIDLSLILYGSFFMYRSMKFLSRTGEAASMFSEARRKNQGTDNSYFDGGKVKGKFKGGLESLGKSNATVSDLYNQLGLSEFEDDFERNLYDSYDSGVGAGRTCHLCMGQGCARCKGTGMLN